MGASWKFMLILVAAGRVAGPLPLAPVACAAAAPVAGRVAGPEAGDDAGAGAVCVAAPTAAPAPASARLGWFWADAGGSTSDRSNTRPTPVAAEIAHRVTRRTTRPLLLAVITVSLPRLASASAAR